VSITEFPDKVSLYIHDNGSGFVFNNIEKNYNSGNGLKNMRERVSLLNGDFFINSNSGGTTIEVEIPFENV
jgi:signal transduction histidine kinase